MVEKQVLVTGSSRGIGEAIALRLANDGFRVVVHGFHQPERATAVAQAIQERKQLARVLCFDVSNREQSHQVLTNDIERYGAYFGVVCNAGMVDDQVFPAIESNQWDRMIRSNLDSFYNVLKPIVMPMIRAGHKGRIVTLSSISGLLGNRGQVHYSAAKAGIIGATKALALELAKRKITVNCVAPGLIDTDMTENPVLDEIKKQIPLRRFGKPQEVASLISYLFSEDAAYITRQVISVNGGLF